MLLPYSLFMLITTLTLQAFRFMAHVTLFLRALYASGRDLSLGLWDLLLELSEHLYQMASCQ